MDVVVRPEDMGLLRGVVAARRPDLLPLLDKLGVELLTETEREDLREVVSDEFMVAGLRSDDEPNAYGLRLERLIELLGRLSEWSD